SARRARVMKICLSFPARETQRRPRWRFRREKGSYGLGLMACTTRVPPRGASTSVSLRDARTESAQRCGFAGLSLDGRSPCGEEVEYSADAADSPLQPD